jgi:hypothetical protein
MNESELYQSRRKTARVAGAFYVVRSDVAWDRWSGKLPVSVNANTPNS